MPNSFPRIPTYRRHKARHCAVVTLGGCNVYLGAFGSPESKIEYERVISEWLARGRIRPLAVEARHSVNEVMLAYVIRINDARC